MRIKRSSLKEVCTLNFNVYYLEVQSLKKFYLNLNALLETVKNLKISPYTVFNKCYALSFELFLNFLAKTLNNLVTVNQQTNFMVLMKI